MEQNRMAIDDASNFVEQTLRHSRRMEIIGATALFLVAVLGALAYCAVAVSTGSDWPIVAEMMQGRGGAR